MSKYALLMVIMALISASTVATTYDAGGSSSGWDLNSDVGLWAESNKFYVGDILVFKYTTEHNLQEVGQLQFIRCDTTNPIQEYNDGYTMIELTQPEPRFFICGQLDYCEMGLKMEVDVLPLTVLSANETSYHDSP